MRTERPGIFPEIGEVPKESVNEPPHPEAQIRGGGGQKHVDCTTEMTLSKLRPIQKSLFRCLINFTPYRPAIFTPPRTIFAANFESVGKVIFI